MYHLWYKQFNGDNMVERFSVEENGNMVYIAEDYIPVTSCFDSYDRTDLQKIVDMMNNLNQCYFDKIKKNGELTKENQLLKKEIERLKGR